MAFFYVFEHQFMKVLKFGGTSVGNKEAIEKVSQILDLYDDPLTVVVSAVGGVTDQLQRIIDQAVSGNRDYEGLIQQLLNQHVKLLNELTGEQKNSQLEEIIQQLSQICNGIFLLKELTPKSVDFVLGTGERLSSIIMHAFLAKKGMEVQLFDSRDFIVTKEAYGRDVVDLDVTLENVSKTKAHLKSVNIFPGFIATNAEGEATTLGRGGSDYSAAILANVLDAEVLEIWTDVDGLMTADPRLVKRSCLIKNVSYEEAMELSHFGAKVIYAPSIQPVFDKKIPVKIKNTFDEEALGTLISSESNNGQMVKGISSIQDVTLISISGNSLVGIPTFTHELFKVLAESDIHVVFVTQSSSEHTITLGMQAEEAIKADKVLKKAFGKMITEGHINPFKVERELSLIALVGSKMKNEVGVSGLMFHVLGRNGVSLKAISQGSSERNISAIIAKADLNKSLNVLHESFFLSRMKRINLFIIGVGNVGKAFLEQLKKQFKFLKENHQLNIKIIGVANSRKMQFEKDGIPISGWKEALEKGVPFGKEDYLTKMHELNFRNSIFIDITASSDISELYLDVLKKSISVVTPNKIAATRTYDQYLSLKATTKRYSSQFLIETNVCAGLPVLSTLNDLVRSGDQVNKVEAVLSGTLNFLFNEYDGSKSFTEIIQYAKEAGYTEPDPRLDLSGEDVMRKLLILIRESGYEAEYEDLQMHSFLPDSCQDSVSLEEFYEQVMKEESFFKKLYNNAVENGKRLKVVATYENGKGTVALKEIAPDHPFYNLEGKDNIVLFYTNRYSEQPLVIKGAGAGAEVTASGIFADVLRIAQSDY